MYNNCTWGQYTTVSSATADNNKSKNIVWGFSPDNGSTWLTLFDISLNKEYLFGTSKDGGTNFDIMGKFALNPNYEHPVVNPNPTPKPPAPVTPTKPTPNPVVIPPAPTKPTPAPAPIPTPSFMATVDVSNFSEVDDNTVKQWCDAVQIQCDRDVAPIWGHSVKLRYLPKSGNLLPQSGNWHCGIFDNSDQPGILGWHDAGPNGEPIMKIFTSEAERFHDNPCTTLSHEVLESIGDPDANTTVTVSIIVNGIAHQRQFYRENCDPVENNTYQINNLPVSDFITLQWFQNNPPPGSKFSFLQSVQAPFQIAKGGYMLYSDDNGGSWNTLHSAYIIPQVNKQGVVIGKKLAENARFDDQAGIHQRRYRRKKPRSEWILSTYDTTTK